jgi:hypothetical protein
VAVVDCRSYNNGRNGIRLVNRAYPCGGTHNSPSLIGNELHDNERAGIGIFVGFMTGCSGGATYRGLVDGPIIGNFIHSNGRGIYGVSQSERNNRDEVGSVRGSFRMDIYNNLIVRNEGEGILFEGENERATDALEMGTAVDNNTISDNGAAGFKYPTNIISGQSMRNNIFTFNQAGVVQTKLVASTNAVISNNNVYGNSLGNWVGFPEAFGAVAGVNRNGAAADAFENISVDPGFLRPGLDLHLRLDLPMIDAGTTNTLAITDWDGEARSNHPDIGYDEAPAALTASAHRAGGSLVLTIGGGQGRHLTVEASPDLVDWSEVTSLDSADSLEQVEVPILPGAERRFFRVRAE